MPFTIVGTYNGGNVFTAQLSNTSGSFASPTNIGTLTQTTAGTISATIPSGASTGSGYRIRVVSSNPSVTGTDNGSNLTINASPSANAGTAITTCSNSGAVNITAGSSAGNNAGVSWTSTNGTGSFINSTSLTTCTYTPSAADISAGNRNLTLTATGNSPCSNVTSAKTITITTLPTASISYSGSPWCTSSGVQNVSLTGTAGGTYSSTAGLTINASTGQITPGSSTGGTYTVTYTIAAAGGCSQVQATTSVTITAMPAATISYTGSPWCTSAGLQNVTLTGTSGGTFSSTAGLTINASTGQITPGSSTDGGYTVTYTIGAGGGCAQLQATTSVTINSLPGSPTSVTPSSGVNICNGSGTNVNATSAGNTIYWYTVSTGGSTIGSSSSGVNFSVSPSGNTTYYAEAVTGGGCASSTRTATALVSVYTMPTGITASAAPNPICIGNNLTLTGGATGATSWAWSGPDGYSSSSQSPAISITAETQTGIYSLVVSNPGCTAIAVSTSSVNVNTISSGPTVSADLTTVYEANPVVLTVSSGSLGTAASWVWYAGGCGTGGPVGSGTTITIYPTSTTTYYVRAEGTCNTSGCASVSITVNSFSSGVSNDGANIVIEAGAYFYASGGFINMSFNPTTHGSVDIDGTMMVAGDWKNDALSGNVFANIEGTPDGTIKFIGSSTQTITGTADTYFENFECNNSVPGTSISLSRNCIVTGSATFTDGVVTTGSNRFIMSNTAPGNISGGSNISFVNGNFRRYLDATGVVTGTYPIPLGDGTATTNYKKADIVNTNLTGVSWIDVSVAVVAGDPGNIDENLSTSQNSSGIVDFMEAAEWNLVPNSDPSGGTYGVNLYVANTGLSSSDDNMFCPLKRPSASTSYANWSTFEGTTTIPAVGAGGRVFNGGNGYAQRMGYTTFSKHGIGRAATVLPVALLLLHAECKKGIAKISWETASEIQNDYFTLERSCNEAPFEMIGTIDGNGNSSTVIHYTYADASFPGNTCLYRLKQGDFDGSTRELGIVPVNCNDKNFESGNFEITELFPVPAKENLTLLFYSSSEKELTLKIADLLERKMHSENIDANQGLNAKMISIENLINGFYFLTISDGTNKITKKIIKKQ